MSPRRLLFCLSVPLLVLSACVQQRAQPVRPLSYDELFAQSDLVLIGRIGRIKETGHSLRLDGGPELAIQQVRIDVLHVLKGEAGDAVYLESYDPRGAAAEGFDAALLARMREHDPRDYLFFLVAGPDRTYYRFTQGAPVTAYSLRVLERPAGEVVMPEP